jgi:hypothetical protein
MESGLPHRQLKSMVVDCLANRSIRTLISVTMLGDYEPQT